MPRLILILLIALAACAAPAPHPGFRDAALGLYSAAAFEAPRLAGHWTEVAAFAAPGTANCRAGHADFAQQGGRTVLTADLCLSGKSVAYSGPLTFTHAGRMQLDGADPAGIGQPWWVIWVDGDYRTLVIGTPSGAFGFILNRGPGLPPDRLTAARDILAWSGYDTSRLRLLN